MNALDYSLYMERKSFAEHGDDILLMIYLQRLFGVNRPARYLDIGSNHPIMGNNTYLFYIHGGRGVLVDPNPNFKELTESLRKWDAFYNAGIKFDDRSEATYYDFGDKSGYNTFVEYMAENIHKHRPNEKIALKRKLTIPLLDVNQIIGKHFPDGDCDILSIDCEGADEGILRKINFDFFKPRLIILEHRTRELDAYLAARKYKMAFVTPANSVYADSTRLLSPQFFREIYYVKSGRMLPPHQKAFMAAIADALASANAEEGGALEHMVDEEYYYARYPDVKKSGLKAGFHYFKCGWREGRSPAPWFDAAYYLKCHPEIGDVNPLVHYMTIGMKQGFLPSPSGQPF